MKRARKLPDLRSSLAPEELILALGQLREIDADLCASRVASLAYHADEWVRHEALRVLCLQWQMPAYHDVAVRSLLRDASAAVQSIAAFAVVATSTAETRDDDIRALLEVLDGHHADSEVIMAAYGSLQLLLKREEAEMPDAVRDFDRVTDVDWAWIATVRAEYCGN